MNRRASSRWAGAAVTMLLLAGCQTPPAVYELAEKSSSNAGVFQGHLAALSAQSASLAQQRAENVISLEEGTARLDAHLRRELYMQEQSRAAGDWAEVNQLLGRLIALRDQLIAIEQSAIFASAQRRKELLSQQTQLETYKAALRQTATALSALAKRETTQERAKFLATFARAVRDDMKKALEDGDQTAIKAKALIDSIKGQATEDETQ